MFLLTLLLLYVNTKGKATYNGFWYAGTLFPEMAKNEKFLIFFFFVRRLPSASETITLKVFGNLSSLHNSVRRYVMCWRGAWCVCSLSQYYYLACRLSVLEAQCNLYFHNKFGCDWDKHWFRKILFHGIWSLWQKWLYGQVWYVSRSLHVRSGLKCQ